MILNASKIELIDQMTEDISKTLKFSVTGMKTTDISGNIAIKFTYKIVDIDGGNDWIEEELTTSQDVEFTCNPLSHCKVCENSSSNCISCDTNGNYPVFDPNLY